MVINSTKYKKHKQSPLVVTEHRTQKRPPYIRFEFQVLSWDRHNNVERLHRLMYVYMYDEHFIFPREKTPTTKVKLTNFDLYVN